MQIPADDRRKDRLCKLFFISTKFVFPRGCKMARPRTPTNVLEMRGAYKKNPQRKREDEPEVATGLGPAPDYFSPEQADAWNVITSQCHAGVLCHADGIAVEIAAVLLANFRANPVDMPAAKLARLDSLLARFGMTPSDRSKVAGAKKEEPANPFAKLIKKKGAA
jgi:hypothetical protein